ncbi:hypothetical protein [Cellulomonas sp. B6]|jgi:hypothetical protein|uniref:hypothetical protein n=1 Tax=Cellulomonas sp. B6 TaxID=1295626 RepID=UPI00073B2CA5|nr:hypothetical protein [Cellulomonas sp. B6]KSW21258.1 hypothetical protein ATM99_14640 [Cellulomonas sp. B6]
MSSSSVIGSALTDVRAQVSSARAAVVRSREVTWTGTAAAAADRRRGDLLTALRRCDEALDAADRLVEVARRAEMQCVPPAGLAITTVGR